MAEELFAAVDGYLDGLFGGDAAALAAALNRSQAGGLPPFKCRRRSAGSCMCSRSRASVEMRQADDAPFDLVFIDAESPRMRRTSTPPLSCADPARRSWRTTWSGAVVCWNPTAATSPLMARRAFNAIVATHPRLTTAFTQQVGVKGHDGMALSVVQGP